MSMSSDLRVKVNKDYAELYTDWKNIVGSEMHELFFLCVCLGYNAMQPLPLGKQGESKFWSGTITPEEWSSFYAMLLQLNEMDPSCIADDKNVLSVIESYANGGMKVLIDELLNDFTIGSADAIRLDKSSAKGLAKTILVYISENTK